MIVRVMGEGARAVSCFGSAEHALCCIEYDGGRGAALLYGAGMPYALDIQRAAGEPSEYVPVKSAFFPSLLRDILRFFETGDAPVPEAQTIECMKLREAVLRSAARPGVRVSV